MKGARPSYSRSAGTVSVEGPRSSDAGLVQGYIAAGQESLSRAATEVDMRGFKAVADIVAQARIVYLVGSRRAYPVTTYMAVALSKLGIRNVLVDNVGSSAFDQVRGGDADDVMIAVNFSPYNSITAEIAAAGVQSKIPLVAITDSALSPLVRIAKARIEVVESEFAGFRSLAATITVVTALVLAISRRREETSEPAARQSSHADERSGRSALTHRTKSERGAPRSQREGPLIDTAAPRAREQGRRCRRSSDRSTHGA
jgi:DNA-binding MurR/RpiR family transcriptional regulator